MCPSRRAIGAIHMRAGADEGGFALGHCDGCPGLALGGRPLLAQEAPPETTSNTPATNSIGPRDLQNFNLQGTVTRRADQPVPAPPAPAPQRPQAVTPSRSQPTERPTASGPQSVRAQALVEPTDELSQRSRDGESRARSPQPLTQSAPSSSVTVNLPPVSGSTAAGSSVLPSSSETAATKSEPDAARLAPPRGLPLLPWLLAAHWRLPRGAPSSVWRNRTREALAGGSEFEAYLAPEKRLRQPRPRRRPRAAPTRHERRRRTRGNRLDPSAALARARLRANSLRRGRRESHVRVSSSACSIRAARRLARCSSRRLFFSAGPEQEQRDRAPSSQSPVGQGQRIAAIPPCNGWGCAPRFLRPGLACSYSRLAVATSSSP